MLKTKKSKTEVEIEIDLADILFNVEQAAEFLGCCSEVVQRKLASGEIKGFKKMRKWFIFKSDLYFYIKS